jgi:hypothetical protein
VGCCAYRLCNKHCHHNTQQHTLLQQVEVVAGFKLAVVAVQVVY